MKRNLKGLVKLADEPAEPTVRPLSFGTKNKSAIIGSLSMALAAGLVGAFSSKDNKKRIKRAILAALAGLAIGASAGHLHDKNMFSSRIKANRRKAGTQDLRDALENLSRIQEDAQYSYMHNTGGKPAKSFKELGNGWDIGSYGSNIHEYVVHGRINKDDTPQMKQDKNRLRNSALSKLYRYGIVDSGEDRTPAAVALPEYDTDDAPGIVSRFTVKEDPADFYRNDPRDHRIIVFKPESKARLRNIVMNGGVLTKEVLDEIINNDDTSH